MPSQKKENLHLVAHELTDYVGYLSSGKNLCGASRTPPCDSADTESAIEGAGELLSDGACLKMV